MTRFSVGITGHREVANHGPEIKVALRRVFRAIANHVKRRHPPCAINLVSPLADGVDQIAAEMAVELNWGLLVTLPCPAADYEMEFDDAEKRTFNELRAHPNARVIEMDHSCWQTAQRGPDGECNKTAFEVAGRVMLGHSDLVVAVWDGRRERGPGGTGQMVREAVASGVPVVWINSVKPESIGLLTQTPELNPTPHSIRELENAAGGPGVSLASLIDNVLDPPRPPDIHGKPAADPCAEYQRECSKFDRDRTPDCLEEIYPALYRWLAPPSANPEPPKPVLGEQLGLIWNAIGDHYALADGLAIQYSNLYRGSFVLNYVLGALAVTVALIGGIAMIGQEFAVWRVIMGVLEVILLACMIGNWRTSKRACWQQKFTDYRLLAEHLRHLQFALPLGLVPVTRTAAHDWEHPRQHWAGWYLRNVARTVGFAGVNHTDPAFRTQMLGLLRTHWAKTQIDYQTSVQKRSHQAERKLISFAFALVIGTIVVCVIHVLLELSHLRGHGHHTPHWIPDWLGGLLVILAAGFPAWAAVAHAIAERAEYTRLHKRSAAMAAALRNVEKRLDALDVLNQKGELRTWQLIAVAQEMAADMLQEAFDWRIQNQINAFYPG